MGLLLLLVLVVGSGGFVRFLAIVQPWSSTCCFVWEWWASPVEVLDGWLLLGLVWRSRGLVSSVEESFLAASLLVRAGWEVLGVAGRP